MIKKFYIITIVIVLLNIFSCAPPPEREVKPYIKHNYIVLLDLSDRLIIEKDQPERDKYLINEIYKAFEQKVRLGMYVRSTDKIRVVIAPQESSPVKIENYENE